MQHDAVSTTRLWLDTFAALDPEVRGIVERLERLQRLSGAYEADWVRPEIRALANKNPTLVHLVAAALAALGSQE